MALASVSASHPNFNLPITRLITLLTSPTKKLTCPRNLLVHNGNSLIDDLVPI